MSTVVPERPVTQEKWVGTAMRRKEDARLLRGEGQYIADLHLPNALQVGFVRSTQAHARLRSIDLSKALAVPGVAAGFTARDLLPEMKEFLIPSLRPQVPGQLRVPPALPLALDKVVFAGEPIAVLLAENKYALEDAVERVEVKYAPLPVVTDPEQALKPKAPRIYEEWPDNVLYSLKLGDASEAFAKADVVIKERFSVPRTGASPMEPRGAAAVWDEHSGLTLWLTTQRPHIVRLGISEVLDIPYHKVRVIAPKDQGGGFGVKAPVYREDIVISLLARRLRRPLRWIESRAEHFLAGMGQERGQIHYLELAATRAGTIVAVRDRCIGDTGDGKQGVYLGFLYPFLGCLLLPSCYRIPVVEIDLTCAVTNKPSLTPSRAFGEFPVRFALERAIDLLAQKLGLEPAELRRRNLITDFPHTTATGLFYDSGDYAGGFQRVVDALELPELRREQARLRQQGRYLGVGFGVGTEISGVSSQVFVALENQPGFGAATMKVDPRGTIHVVHGDAPQGQGHETVIAQAVADELGVHPDDVFLQYGDTWTTPFGSGTLGSRNASYTVSAAVLAAREVRKKMAVVAAHDLKLAAPPEEFEFRNRQIVWRRDPEKKVGFADVARHLIMAPINLPAGVEAGLEHTAYYEPEVPAMFAASFHGAMVEVDPRTGEFKILRYVVGGDCGKAINPLLVEGQEQGGVVMGLGNSIFEEFVYDEKGELKTQTLLDYLMPSAADVPHVEYHDVSFPCPYTPLGTKGKGEAIPGPVPGALANAIADALAPFGAKITELPLRPEKIWRAIQEARREASVAAGRAPGSAAIPKRAKNLTAKKAR